MYAISSLFRGAFIAAALLLAIPSTLVGQTAEHRDDLIIYEVFVRNFSEAGTLSEVERKLDHIADLGVNVVWLMPIYPIGEVLRKGSVGSPYAVRDYQAVNPDLGTIDDLKRLVQATHQRGMKLIIDIVPNHVAADHPWITEHPDWIVKDAQGKPKPPIPAWSDVVQLNFESKELREQMFDVMKYWITEYDIDGYRVDVAGMVPQSFWREMIPRLRAVKSDLILLAEAEGLIYDELGFDLCYDDTMRNLLVKIGQGKEPAAKLNTHVASVINSYSPLAHLMRFTENHDHNRTVNLIPPPIDRAAVAAVFTLPGAPMIYNGQEMGNAKRLNLFERDPIDWKQGSKKTLKYYQRMVQLRNDHPALMSGQWLALKTDRDDAVAYLRSDDREEILVLLNFGHEDIPITITRLPTVSTIVGLEDLVGERSIPFSISGSTLTVLAPCRPDGIYRLVRK
jgi:glycosidase